MGNLDFSANADQLKELAAYMASQINVPTIGIGGGYAPIGTIISVMGTTAPQDYLACDGTVYSIADYPQLADYFESQFGESNHFGGNGTTTFAVPDLQGEFLRGTGTNSHTNQGSGANVGEHQDGTEHRSGGYYSNGIRVLNYPDNSPWMNINSDSDIAHSATEYKASVSSEGVFSEAMPSFTSRPTNTSVLYCIKAVVAGEVYSTEERVVGTWIDGKPMYQKTIYRANPVVGDVLLTNISMIETISKHFTRSNTIDGDDFYYDSTVYAFIRPYIDSNNNAKLDFIKGTAIGNTISDLYLTVRYTKTTD